MTKLNMTVTNIFDTVKKRDLDCRFKVDFSQRYLGMSYHYFNTVGDDVSVLALRNLWRALQARGWFDLAEKVLTMLVSTEVEPVRRPRRANHSEMVAA